MPNRPGPPAAAVPPGRTAADLDEAVRAAQRGDTDAFRLLYRDTQPRLLRYVRALAGDDAEDVASETWLQVSRDLRRFTGGYDAFRGWVATIGRHRALDQARQRSRRPPTVPVPAEDLDGLAAAAGGPGQFNAADDTAAGAIEAVGTDAALALIATLPPDQAEAVLLRAVFGLDAKTAGQVIGKRAGAVRSAAQRGLHTLARRLEEAAGPHAGSDPGGDSGGARKGNVRKGVTRTRDLALKEMR